MKKFRFFLWLFLLACMTFSGCGSSGGNLNIIGNWSWTQQQTQPFPRENQGTMAVTGINGNQVTGTITWISPAPGGPYNFTGTADGMRVTINYTYGATEETWTLDFVGNSFSGAWTNTNGPNVSSGTINGTKIY